LEDDLFGFEMKNTKKLTSDLISEGIKVTDEHMKQGHKGAPHILLLDDDRGFGKIMARVARKQRIPFTFCESVKDVTNLTPTQFDVAIVDYDLGKVTGIQFAKNIEKIIGKIPVLLVSENADYFSDPLPSSVKNAIVKSVGPVKILMSALEVHDNETPA